MANSVSWISAEDRLPTAADTDDFGEVYWCGGEYVCRITPQEVASWDWSKPHNLAGHWAKTGIVRPSPPTCSSRVCADCGTTGNMVARFPAMDLCNPCLTKRYHIAKAEEDDV